MRIVTVCEMNQARSPFAQAVLERNFPEYEIISCGVSAHEGAPVLESVIEIARSWDVPIRKMGSTSISSARNSIKTANLVITSDIQQSAIIREMGYQGDLISFEEILPDKDFIPKDPNGLATDAIARELGKVGALTLRAVIDKISFPHRNQITAVIPRSVSDLQLAITNAKFESSSQGAILIDADIRAPMNMELDTLGIERVFYDIKLLETSGFPKISGDQILTYDKQANFPEKFFLSPVWRNALARASSDLPVVFVTAPRLSGIRRLPDSYLASYMADKFITVSC